MTNFFAPAGPIGPDYDSAPDDVRGAKRALNRLGRYRPPFGEIDEVPDRGLFESVKGFQRDRGLKVDGVVKPKGETARALDQELSGQAAARATPADAIAKNMLSGEPQDPDDGGRNAVVARAARPAFKLSRSVGAKRDNDAQDVVNAKSALAWTGHYPRERAQRPDAGVDRLLTGSLAAFQRAQGLTVDGWMRPGGETERALAGVVGTMIKAAQSAAPAHRPAAVETRAPQDDEKGAALARDTKDRPHDGERCRILLERIERYRRELDEIEEDLQELKDEKDRLTEERDRLETEIRESLLSLVGNAALSSILELVRSGDAAAAKRMLTKRLRSLTDLGTIISKIERIADILERVREISPQISKLEEERDEAAERLQAAIIEALERNCEVY